MYKTNFNLKNPKNSGVSVLKFHSISVALAPKYHLILVSLTTSAVYLADLGEARCCSTKKIVIKLVAKSVTLFLPKASRPRQAQTVRDGASSHKIDCVAQV